MSGRGLYPVLAAMAVLLLAACAGEKSDAIRLATDGAYPPYIATDADGNLYGMEAELAADLCRRMGVRCEWVRQSFDGLIPALQHGRFDAVFSSLSITEERRKVIDMTMPYFVGPTLFMSLSDGRYRQRLSASGSVTLGEISPEERALIEQTRRALQGATVGIERASTHEAFLRSLFADAITIKTYGTGDELFLDLSSGRIDLALVGLGEMKTFVEEQARLGRRIEEVGPEFKGGILGDGIAVGLRKGNDALRQRFDQAIIEATRDGTIRRLGMKWFGSDGSPALPAG